jgi:nitroreductase
MENSNMLGTILERTSIRDFEGSKEVSDEMLRKILRAGIAAPSAGNIQPRTIMVVRDKVVRENLYELCEDQNCEKTYASHYKEEFVKTINKKLIDPLLRKQGLLKDQ